MPDSTPPRRQRSSNQTAHQTYGYHNTFHTHAQLPLGSPPAYARRNDNLAYLHAKARSEAEAEQRDILPPPYTCTVSMGGVLGVRHELLSPFHVSGQRDWTDCFVVLCGTQLRIHRAKNPGLWSKNKLPSAGRLVSSYTLQHAEVGIAADFKKSPLIPKSPFAHLVPASARHKLYESDPHLFEPIRQHVIRIRVETEQLLLCASSQEEMLDWVEALCAAIDISAPLEDRSEPRYRSLPRRNRRQRLLDGAQLADNLDSLSTLDAGRRIVAEQERIIRQLYPHLSLAPQMGNLTTITAAADNADDEFDPEDVRFPTRQPLSRVSSQSSDSDSPPPTASTDGKLARLAPSPAQTVRYRRRCAPVLLSASPRVSDVVYSDRKRMRINVKDHTLVPYTSHPPRYDAHGYKKRVLHMTFDAAPQTVVEKRIERPASPLRVASDDSIASISFGFDAVEGDRIDPLTSTPPSPSALSKARMEERQLGAGKGKAREEGGISAVALGVGLLV